MNAVLAGATGLVGSHIARLAGPGLLTLQRGDYAKLDSLTASSVDRVYCALGTTMRQAGSQEAFRQVDYGYVLALARWARAQGATDFRLVSSVGAAPSSSNFYLRVKGETERDLATLGFTSLQIFRPGVLLGERKESRAGESIGRAFSLAFGPLLLGPLAKYRATKAEDVARAMVTWPAPPGVHIYHQPDLFSQKGHDS